MKNTYKKGGEIPKPTSYPWLDMQALSDFFPEGCHYHSNGKFPFPVNAIYYYGCYTEEGYSAVCRNHCEDNGCQLQINWRGK
jgi:hypothetical protein